MNKKILALVIVIAALGLGGYLLFVKSAADARVLTIMESTQGTYGDLKIGLDNSGSADDPKPHLWLFYRDDSSKNTQMVVHAGQRVEIGKYAFRVEKIEGGSRISVSLRFEPGPSPVSVHSRIFWKSVVQGDEVLDERDPASVCKKLQTEQGLENCKIIVSKKSENASECVDGKSIAGCFACKFDCL